MDLKNKIRLSLTLLFYIFACGFFEFQTLHLFFTACCRPLLRRSVVPPKGLCVNLNNQDFWRGRYRLYIGFEWRTMRTESGPVWGWRDVSAQMRTIRV